MDPATRIKQLKKKYSMARRRQNKKQLMKSKMAVHTENAGHEYEIEWTVENVLKLVKVTFCSRLSLDRNCKSRFHLIVRIDGEAEETYSDVCIGFQRIDSIKESIRLCYDFSLQNASGDVYKRNEGNLIYPANGRTQWCLDLKVTDMQHFIDPDIITEDNLREKTEIHLNLVSKELMVWDENRLHGLYVLPEDSLVVKGTIRAFGCCLTSRLVPELDPVESEVTETDLMKDFEFGFQSGLLADLQLNCQGETLSAHKFVLSARSPVLRRLLQRREDRGDDSPINVQMKKTVLETFLRYLYVGIVGEVRWATVVELYEAGVWFEVTSLKQHCSNTLARNVSEKRACQILKLADKYGDDSLKKVVIRYIRDNFFKVKETEGWVALIRQSPALASDALEEIALSIH